MQTLLTRTFLRESRFAVGTVRQEPSGGKIDSPSYPAPSFIIIAAL